MFTTKPIPTIAAIHDLSGFGRASLTSIIPVLSTMELQVCPLPTSILSTHTSNFDNYFFLDLTDQMEKYIDHWKSLHLDFDAIYSGFLGSPKQADIIKDFIESFRKKNQIIVVDPVLGDEGEKYGTITEDMVKEMQKLIKCADVITPNITEAALLLDEEPVQSDEIFTYKYIKNQLKKLAQKGPEVVVITSVPIPGQPKKISATAYDSKNENFWKVECAYVPAYFPGTGDIFTSVLTGSLLKGYSLPVSLDRSVQFVTQAIAASFGHNYNRREGVLLESVLKNLRAPLLNTNYESF